MQVKYAAFKCKNILKEFLCDIAYHILKAYGLRFQVLKKRM